MSLQSFYDGMKEEGLKTTGESSSLGIIGQVLIEFGVHRYVQGHDFWEFWLEIKDRAAVKSQSIALNKKLIAAGSNDKANFGIKITVFADVLSSESAYKTDLMAFTPAWQNDAYNLISESASENDLPAGKKFWGQVQYKANPFHVAKGENGKTDTDQDGNPRFPSIRVPVRQFISKAEAQAFADANSGKTEVNQLALSDKAQATFGDDETARANTAEILNWLNEAKNGRAFAENPESYSLPKPATPAKLKQYIADIYEIEPGDIDVLEADQTPF